MPTEQTDTIHKTDVMIHIFSTHESAVPDAAEDNAEPEQFELSTEGKLFVSDGRLTIEYEESALTGMEGSKTCISFEIAHPGLVTMLRTGSVETVLVFEEGIRHNCTYNAEPMAFEVCVYTEKVVNLMTEAGGELFLSYSIEFRGAAAEMTSMKIRTVPIHG